jgi:hypothetical protein
MYREDHKFGANTFPFCICQKCAPKGIEQTKILYNVYIIGVGRAHNLHMDGEHREQWIKDLQQLHPFGIWLSKHPFYKFLYDSGMDAIDGPLGQFTKAVKME